MINDLLKKIKEAIYGEEVRNSIHDAIEQCYKDATGHPESVAATVKEIGEVSANLSKETADRKAEVNTERKRIDNLIASGTAQTQEIGKTIVQTGTSSSYMNMDYLAADKYYSGLFDGITFKDTDFFYIPSESGSGAEYVGKLLKPGLYHIKFCVKISKDGGLPEIPMRIMLKKGSTTTGEYSELKTEYIIFPQTSSSKNMQNVEYIFAITEPTYIKLFVTSIADGTGTFGFNASECTITAIDWKGKQSADLSELHDLRIGADSTVYDTAGEAVRKQIGNLTEDLGEQIGSQKFSGYYNLAKVANATIYRGKRLARFNTDTYKPVLVDDAPYTTVIMPIDKAFGNYNMLIGENPPSSGIAMARYKEGVAFSPTSYDFSRLSWDAKYDDSNHVLSYLTNKIFEMGGKVDTYAFCFYNTEPIVYPDTFPELNSGVLQLLKIIGKEQLTDDLLNVITNVSNSLSVDIMLPNEIYSVIGHEHNIYFWNAIKCSNIYDYTIRVSGANYGSRIKNLGDCVRMKPTVVKNQRLVFKVYKNDALLKEKSTTIKMIADNRPSARKVIFIGDSMVENGYEIAELKKMFGEDMTFYGTRQGGQKDSSDTRQTVYHEGRSSWDSGEYLNSASKNNVANAFYNPSTSKFDFSYYMNNNTSFNDVTDVFIQLGNNDADKMTKEQYVSNIQYIVDDIHKYNSNIKVFACIPSPVVNDGYAYGTRNYVDVQYSKNHLFDCGKHLMENVKNAICVPIYQNLDCYNDFPKTEVAFSERNPDKHTVCNENVHPSKHGFYKFADTLYCTILGAYTN